MSIKFIHYDSQGEIQGSGYCPPGQLAVYQREGLTLLEVGELVNHKDSYFDFKTQSVLPRPTMPLTLNDLPIPCAITVKSKVLGTSETFNVDDGSFEYEDTPGVYELTLKAFPYLDGKLEITL